MTKEEIKAEIAKREKELAELYRKLREIIYAPPKNIQSGKNTQR